MRVKSLVAAVLLAGAATLAQAAEFPIGKPLVTAGMEINTVYLQPITMEPAGMMNDAKKSDIHLEADIHAVAKNPNGYAEGDWIPGLEITYKLQKAGSAKVIEGLMMPMVASDGPHYGDNVKLDGVGKYTLTMVVNAPGTLAEFGCKMGAGAMAASGAHAAHGGMGPWCFGRHVDKETGVGPWFKPITKTVEFTFSGIGKKGGY
ncbi:MULTISPECIES: iron transporter [Pandoraea]|uniref:34 kDa membrane antigen n=2 Tax=Pandoraea TaxID=93217 RepID=A0A5E4Y4N0_9BURK|nr:MULTISPECIES: iron transporter [Pandoraea]ALS58944.1 hypothetical protein AT302_03275 [Pandoraea norimbergensis]VVE37644.1 34 kDa membrane antigen [Pandoraea iniqua]VVE43514.1 34 kDa membrane antigen [Pandoraea iniqua]